MLWDRSIPGVSIGVVQQEDYSDLALSSDLDPLILVS